MLWIVDIPYEGRVSGYFTTREAAQMWAFKTDWQRRYHHYLMISLNFTSLRPYNDPEYQISELPAGVVPTFQE